MAIIKSVNGLDIIVDDDKLEELSKFKWYAYKNGYASRYCYENGTPKKVLMHRELTNCPEGMVVVHINENKLDNRLSNLEVVTQQVNMQRSAYNRFFRRWNKMNPFQPLPKKILEHYKNMGSIPDR